MLAPRLLVAMQPGLYAEALAFSVRQRRPGSEVFLLDSPEEPGPRHLEAEVRRLRPHLVVANRVPQAAKEEGFWVEVEEPVRGRGLGAEIGADGHSRSVCNLLTEDVLEALDLAGERAGLGQQVRGEVPS